MAEETKTERNMKFALAGESQARRKYKAFKEKAQEEGLEQAAKMFKAAEMGETAHSGYFLNKLNGVKSTSENLQGAIEGEKYEADQVYPAVIDDADEDGQADVKKYVGYVKTVEGEHAELFKGILDNLGDNEEAEYYVCGNCGHVHLSEAPEVCPVCGALKKSFKLVSL